MHKAPTVQRPREIFDNRGRLLGRAEGFRPDPGAGNLGLELELSPELVEALDANVRSVWVSEDQVMAVRKDRMTLDLSLEEIRRFVRHPTTVPELADADPAAGDPVEA